MYLKKSGEKSIKNFLINKKFNFQQFSAKKLTYHIEDLRKRNDDSFRFPINNFSDQFDVYYIYCTFSAIITARKMTETVTMTDDDRRK